MSDMKYLLKLNYNTSFDYKSNDWSVSSLFFKEIHIDLGTLYSLLDINNGIIGTKC